MKRTSTPTGPTGATGATGAAGPTGATGATGATGPVGTWDDLSDVTITAPVDGSVPKYDSGTGHWVDTAIAIDGSNNISGAPNITAGVAFLPDADDDADLGSSLLRFNELFVTNVGAVATPVTSSYIGALYGTGVGVTSAASPYTIDTNDQLVQCNTTSGSVTLNLPPAAISTGRRIVVTKTSASNQCILDGFGSQTINGSATYTMNLLYESAELFTNGADWLINGTSGTNHAATTLYLSSQIQFDSAGTLRLVWDSGTAQLRANANSGRYWDIDGGEIRDNNITANTDVVPDTNGGADLGRSALKFDELFVNFVGTSASPVTSTYSGAYYGGIGVADAAGSPYTVDTNDAMVSCLADTGNVVINLPPLAVSQGRSITFVKRNDVNTCTLTPFGSDVIQGLASWPLTLNGESVELSANGTSNWRITGNSAPVNVSRQYYNYDGANYDASYMFVPVNYDQVGSWLADTDNGATYKELDFTGDGVPAAAKAVLVRWWGATCATPVVYTIKCRPDANSDNVTKYIFTHVGSGTQFHQAILTVGGADAGTMDCAFNTDPCTGGAGVWEAWVMGYWKRSLSELEVAHELVGERRLFKRQRHKFKGMVVN